MDRLRRDRYGAYERDLVHAGREQAFWVLVAFLVTFLVVRLITHAIRAGRDPFATSVSAGRICTTWFPASSSC